MSNNPGNTLLAVLIGAAIGTGVGIKGDLEESFDEMVSKMSTKTDDVITILEAKLAELKEQNLKLQKDKPSIKNT